MESQRRSWSQAAQFDSKMIDQSLDVKLVELTGDDWEMPFDHADGARARGNHIRHCIKCSNMPVSARASMRSLSLGTAGEVGSRQRRRIYDLQTRKSFGRELLSSLHLFLLLASAADADSDESVVFQDVDRTAHAAGGPPGRIAEAFDFFWGPGPCLFFLLVQALFLFPFLVRDFFLRLFVAAEGVFPKLSWIARRI